MPTPNETADLIQPTLERAISILRALQQTTDEKLSRRVNDELDGVVTLLVDGLRGLGVSTESLMELPKFFLKDGDVMARLMFQGRRIEVTLGSFSRTRNTYLLLSAFRINRENQCDDDELVNDDTIGECAEWLEETTSFPVEIEH